MFTIEMLPAAHGDVIWLEYGPAAQPHRIVIDGGPAPTYESGLRRRIAALSPKKLHLELMIVTLIDAEDTRCAMKPCAGISISKKGSRQPSRIRRRRCEPCQFLREI